MPALSSGWWITDLDSTVFEAMSEVVSGGIQPGPVLFAETRHAGGAISEGGTPSEGTVQVVGLVPGEQAQADAMARVDRMWEQLASKIPSNGAYLNFTEGEEQRTLTRSGFDDANRNVLVRVKKEFDPDNLFAHGLDV